jgi:hypothetical protein
MLNTLTTFEDLNRHLGRQAARKIAEILGQIYEDVIPILLKEVLVYDWKKTCPYYWDNRAGWGLFG